MDPFTIGLLVTSGISAAQSYFSGRSQANAAREAAAQQQAGVREARAYAEPKYAEALRIAQEQHAAGQAALSPYAQQGGQGLTALTALLGLPAAPAARAAPAASGPMGTLQKPMPEGFAPTGLPGQYGGAQMIGTPGPMARSGTAGDVALARLMAGAGPAPATQSSYVTLRAPTGETKPVPADQVDFFLARGATRI